MPQTFGFPELISHFRSPFVQRVEAQRPFDILRLDQMHEVISGNKIFKLWYYLREALETATSGVITFGGAWSNHLAAASYACRLCNLPFTAVVRGEKPAHLSPTLQFCLENGATLQFVSRSDYRDLTAIAGSKQLPGMCADRLVIPEGGFSPEGAQGAALIHNFIPAGYTHIVLAVGTGTTLAGLLQSNKDSRLIAVPVLKGLHDLPQRLAYLGVSSPENLEVIETAHFGGYARKNEELVGFMNEFYQRHQIPLDFVYTGKMMFALHQLMEESKLPAQAKILAIHTGGLQGNRSLGKSLIFGQATRP